MDVLEVLGKPYAHDSHPPQSFNCLTLILYVWMRNGFYVPVELPTHVDAKSGAQILIDLAEADEVWTRVDMDKLEEFDAVCMGRTKLHHIGLYFKGGVLHAHESGVRWDKLSELKHQYRLFEGRRLCPA